MANFSSLVLHCFIFFLIFIETKLCISADEDRKLYIVYMGSLPEEKYSPSSHHLSLLQGVNKSSSAENLLVRSYKRSFNGFAAKLSDSEAEKLASSKEIVSVFPSTTYQLHTTRSWSFLGFDETTPDQNPDTGSDIIVGVLDTGIWPESESFSDKGFSPPPKKWKGSCKGGQNFTCNNKIIGARYYGSEGGVTSARDEEGHGTHTSSTAAGNKVKDASFFGLANGIARGGVTSARIAAYKVCYDNGCAGADVLAAFDDAIADGVDIISVSLGSTEAADYSTDEIAIGAFHAMNKGILTSNSAGNSGPQPGFISSVAPWMLSVAASSTDRRIIDKVVLGNGNTLIGTSVNSFSLNGTNFPLIRGSIAKSSSCTDGDADDCLENCLDSNLVKGKIVLCGDSHGMVEPNRVGAVGSIVASSAGVDDVSFVVSFPSLTLTHDNYSTVESYINSSKHPSANIFKSEAIKDYTAPVIASFSSRGPNEITSDILKPDISAPGVDILAAFPSNVPPVTNPYETRRTKFNILSGTSMACPHATGVAAYVKTFHPDWSPAAIKSAIMTTASPMNASRNPDAEFAYGSGHINPLKAINPGLVYDANKEDYIKFLCSIKGNNVDYVRRISGDNSTCLKGTPGSPYNLNYPSMTSRSEPNKSFTITFSRTVTNVGTANSPYKAEVFTSSKLRIKVDPHVLSFKSINEKLSFNVIVESDGLNKDEVVSASLVWSDGSHTVRSPIVIHTLPFV